MAANVDKILSKVLIDKGLIKKEDLDKCLKEAKSSAQNLGNILIKEDLATEDEILEILARELKLSCLNLKTTNIEPSVFKKIPLKIALYYKFVPIKIEKGVLTIAVAYPFVLKIQDEIRTHLGYRIEMVLSCEKNILEILKLRYGLAADTIQEIMAKTPRAGETETAEEKVENIEILGDEEASVIKLVNQIILDAYKARATDIHIEPYRGRIKIRYRVDGVLYNAPVPEDMVLFYNSMLSRIKIMSNLDIVERRLPQDGRAVVRVGNQKVDLRISSMPTPYGESLVIRVLPATMLFSLEKLGLSSSDLAIFEKLVQKPHGIIFVTGPTGSGKTTSLYACLSTINTNARKIITIEDPIEYELEGITQIQVLPEIGFDFARGLRSMLRHDPDIMMVGEVRDLETAQIAIRVALTGHLVFSTLHTNDAASGITRLVDIGVGPYLVASSVEAFIAQRLVRLICPHCKVEDASQPKEIRAEIAREFKLDSAQEITLFKGNGCKECNFTGFHGRAAVFEILLVDEVIKDLVSKKASSMQIKKKAIERGMQTLRQDGLKKVIAGLTTPEEVMKLTQAEENADI